MIKFLKGWQKYRKKGYEQIVEIPVMPMGTRFNRALIHSNQKSFFDEGFT